MLSELLMGLETLANGAGKSQLLPKRLSDNDGARQSFFELVHQLYEKIENEIPEGKNSEQKLQKVMQDESAQSILSELLSLIPSSEKLLKQPNQDYNLNSLLLSFSKKMADLRSGGSNLLNETVPIDGENIKLDFIEEGKTIERGGRKDNLSDDRILHSNQTKKDNISSSDTQSRMANDLKPKFNKTNLNKQNNAVMANLNGTEKIPQANISETPTVIDPESIIDKRLLNKKNNFSVIEKEVSANGKMPDLKASEEQSILFSKIESKASELKSQKDNLTAFNFVDNDKKKLEGQDTKPIIENEKSISKDEINSKVFNEKMDLNSAQMVENGSEEKIETSHVSNKIAAYDINADDANDPSVKIGADKVTSTLSETKMLPKSQPLNSNDIIQQVVEKAKISAKKEHNEITIKLKPEVLGKVHLKISTENQQVTIKVIADSPITKEVLENNLHHLRNGFINQGLEIGSFDVYVGDGSEEFLKGNNFTGFQRNRRRMGQQKEFALGSMEEDLDAEDLSQNRIMTTKDRIDYYV